MPGLDLGDVENAVDQSEQVLAVRADAREHIHRFLRQRAVKAFLDELGITEDGGERGPQLMAHVGDELRLVLAGDFKLAALLGDLLEQAGVLEGYCRLFGKGLHEADDGLREFARLLRRSTSAPSGPPAEQRNDEGARKPASSAASRRGFAGPLGSGRQSAAAVAWRLPRQDPSALAEMSSLRSLATISSSSPRSRRARISRPLAIVENRAGIGAGEIDCTVDNGLEHRLEIERRVHSATPTSPTEAARSRLRACTSSNSRTFSIAITAWSAKVVTSSICLSVNGRAVLRVNKNHADRRSLAHQRHAKHGAKAAESFRCRHDVVFRIGMTSGMWMVLPSSAARPTS